MLKNRSDLKFNCIKSPEITAMLRMVPFDLTCEISDVSSEKLCYNACFCEVHRRKHRMKVETRDTIKFCVMFGYTPTEMLSLLQRGGDALGMKKKQCLGGTRVLSKDKRPFKVVLGADAGR